MNKAVSIIIPLLNSNEGIKYVLHTLSSEYQTDSPSKLEIILVIANVDFSKEELNFLRSLDKINIISFDHGKASLSDLVLKGIEESTGDIIGVLGSTIALLSPGILKYVSQAFTLQANAVISLLELKLGNSLEQKSKDWTYKEQINDEILNTTEWQRNGYKLFARASFNTGSNNSWFDRDINCKNFFFSKKLYNSTIAKSFSDLYFSLTRNPLATNFRLIGEAVFTMLSGHNDNIELSENQMDDQTLNNPKNPIISNEETHRIEFELLGNPGLSYPYFYSTLLDLEYNYSAKEQLSQTDSKAIIVLGMHRSGTSMLTGCLEEAGLYLGDVINMAPSNSKGNKESRELSRLNERVLKHNNGSWDKPPENIKWSKALKNLRDQYLINYVGKKLWGFKDPRTTLTLPGWLESIPKYTLVGIFRHPILVAKSLKERNGFSIERSLSLWLKYNWKIKWFVNNKDLKLIEFSNDENQLRSDLYELISIVGLNNENVELNFFDKTLQTIDLSLDEDLDKGLLNQALNLYEELKVLSI